MPIGVAVIKWDDRIGTKLISKYPENLKVDPTLTMRVYGGHVLGERRESNFISMRVEDINIASYFGGIDINKFIMLILSPDERTEDFQEPLKLIGSEILALPDKKIISLLPEIYDRILAYLMFSTKQRLALLLSSPDRLNVLEYLEKEVYARVSDLQKLADKPIDFILEPLKDQEIIIRKWIEGEEDEIAFLNRHVWLGRIPPSKIDPTLMPTIKAFFETYKITKRDQQLVIKLLTNLDIDAVINALDESPKTEKELETITNLEEDKIVEILEYLENNKFIKLINKRYYLLCKPAIITFIAKDIMRRVLQSYQLGEIHRNIVLHILTEMRNNIAREMGVL